MSFFSQSEAKQFLADKIISQGEYQREPLSEVDKRLLLFSVDEPETANRIPRERLEGDDAEFEAKVTSLLKAAYKRDQDIPQERERYKEAMQVLGKGDHYIQVMANEALPPPHLANSALPAHRVRDLLIYVAIALALVGALIAFAMLREAK